MSDRVLLPDYLVSPVPMLWRVDVSGEAIEWHDRPSTAIMLPHLRILLRALADQLHGLPSLTTILFIVDALSKGWSRELATKRLAYLVRSASKRDTQILMLEDTADWLQALQSIDAELRHGVQAHTAFLCELFEDFARDWLVTSPYETKEVLNWLENVVGDRANLISTRLKSERSAVGIALTTLDAVTARAIDPDAVRLRMRTGLDKLSAANTVEIAPLFPLATLIKKLAGGTDDLSAVARLAQSISATLTLPRLPSDPDLLPMGGVSDVTNRGQPDRLLISELALDDDLLIARIANGQALYVRREQPPQSETKRRCLLVESGIRMWGNMRMYSAAVALGMCIGQERRGGEQMDIVTVAGDCAWIEDFTDREGIERFYERLLADAHPGQAIMDIARGKSPDIDIEHPPILIVSEATEMDPLFRRTIVDFPKPYTLARIEQAGWVDLLQRGPMGDTKMQRMRLQESVLPVVEKPKTRTTNIEDLPMFVKQSSCPLRFSIHPIGPCVQLYKDQDRKFCWVLTGDRRVVLIEEFHLGAIEVGHAPPGRVLASHIIDQWTWLLVIESISPKSHLPVHWLVRVDRKSGIDIFELKLHDEKPHSVNYSFDRNNLLRVGKNVSFFNPDNGELLGTTPARSAHLGGPFFGTTELYVADRFTDDIRWQYLGKLPGPAGVAARKSDGNIVVYARDLSWSRTYGDKEEQTRSTGFHAHGATQMSVVNVHSNKTTMLVSLRGVRSSTDDRYVCLGQQEQLALLSLVEPSVTYIGQRTYRNLAGVEFRGSDSYLNIENIRTRISAISFDGACLVLHTRGKRIAYQRTGDRLREVRLRGASTGTVYRVERPFSRVCSTYARWTLRHIRLPRGDAWLDSRGMLHLRAVDGSELSLALSHDCLAGWHSSGAVFGYAYFTGQLNERGTCTGASPEILDWYESFVRAQQE